MNELRAVLRLFTIMVGLGTVSVLVGAALLLIPNWNHSLGGALLGGGAAAGVAGVQLRDRARQRISARTKSGSHLAPTERADLVARWRTFSILNTLGAILLSIFAIVLLPPAGSAIVVVLTLGSVVATWRFARRVHAGK